jgi:hypothetical protein
VGLSSIALSLILALWTGFVPVLYGPNPEAWNLVVPTCSTPGEVVPHVEHTFPLWATVTVWWTSGAFVAFEGYGPGGPVMNQLGASGNGSFVSNADPVVFEALPTFLTPSECDSSFLVQIHATFSV